MHILVPQPASSESQMFFNVDQSVGHNAANAQPDDIYLVQFLLKRFGERGSANSPEGRLRKERAKRVPITGVCCPLTIDGIKALQEAMKARRFPSLVVDGRISTARGWGYGGSRWSIAELNLQYRHCYPESWPRLQDAPGCPGVLASKTKTIL